MVCIGGIPCGRWGVRSAGGRGGGRFGVTGGIHGGRVVCGIGGGKEGQLRAVTELPTGCRSCAVALGAFSREDDFGVVGGNILWCNCVLYG